MKLKMERQGQFTVNWTISAETQCGVPGNNILSYRVKLETSDKHLDQQGFIIDNNKVHNFFVQKYGKVDKFVSCELIAAEACREFRKMLPNLWAIEVGISGNPNAAWLTAHWARPDDAKEAHPVAAKIHPEKSFQLTPWTPKPLPATKPSDSGKKSIGNKAPGVV